ncbi:MAG TPA: DUF998 domain-containing protein [Rubrobacteraceae bacterium]|nr:DUF998 domain-containing protein [Rubrobacteraceae bacterium]
MRRNLITSRWAALCGIIGPAIFAIDLTALTIAQYGFMINIGWHPLTDPANAWPSGLALGPYGALQDASFAVSGSLLAVFAIGLHRGLRGRSKAGPALLFVSGAAMSLLAFETDPIDRTGPRSPHGLIHDASFVLFVAALLLALLYLSLRMRGDSRWRTHSHYTLGTALGASACLLLGGPAYYLFIAGTLLWFELTAVKLASSPRT